MKKLLLFLVLSPCLVKGQSGYYIGVTNGLNQTFLSNKDDHNAGSELNLRSTYKYSGGIIGGYHFDKEAGLTGFSIGILYTQMGQRYKGEKGSQISYPTFEAYTKLNYLKVPIDFRFSLKTNSNLKPFATVGIYASYLLHYKDYYYATGNTGNETRTIEDKSYTSNFLSTSPYHGTLDQGIYRKFDLGGRIGLGVEYIISDRWSAEVSLRMDYGFLNPENRKDPISLTFDPDVIIFNPNAKLSYWSNNTSKYNYDANYTAKRSATHNMSVGAFLTINYYLKS